MLVSVDIETVCNVPSCKWHGKGAECKEGHALSPWHNKITVIGAVAEDGNKAVFRGDDAISKLRDWLPWGDLAVGGQNFKFDLLNLIVHGAPRDLIDHWTWDSQLMAYVCTDKIPDRWLGQYEIKREKKGPHHRKASKHGLKCLAPYFLGVEPFWEPEDGNLDSDDYVLKDAEYSLELCKVFNIKLRDRGEYEFYDDKLLPWTKMLLAAELRGVELDLPALHQKEQELLVRSIALEKQLDEQWAAKHFAYQWAQESACRDKYHAMAEKAGQCLDDSPRYTKLFEAAKKKLPTKIDYNSPKQMLWLLSDALGYNCVTLDGDTSTGREVLERLADEGHADVKTFLEWRKVTKILTAFIPTYKDLQHEGILHPIYNPTTTRTGRTSSERPNAQQVPPELRPLIKAREGFVFIGYDAAAIEAKLIAAYSSDPQLYNVISQGISLHDHNVKVFLGAEEPHNEIKAKYPVERSAVKNVGFALFYNAGTNRIRTAFAQKGIHLTEAKCSALLRQFHKTYAKAMEFSKSIVDHMEQGEVVKNLFGRPLKIENPEDAYMQAFNTIIQSSASDLNLQGAFNAWIELRNAKIEAYPVLFVHDFVCFEVEQGRAEKADHIIKKCLKDFNVQTDLGPITLEVEGGIMSRWTK